jgi:hypothetical protein
MTILTHLCALSPFGVPYLSGIAPLRLRDFQDIIYRAPIGRMVTRPSDIQNAPRLTGLPVTGGGSDE